MTPIQKLEILDTSKLPERTTVGAVVDCDEETCCIAVQLKRKDFEKMDPKNIAVTQLTW